MAGALEGGDRVLEELLRESVAPSRGVEELEGGADLALDLLLAEDPEGLEGELLDLGGPALDEVDEGELQGDEAGVEGLAQGERAGAGLGEQALGGAEVAAAHTAG